MEKMDISCAEVDPSNESAMSVDEGMEVCLDFEKGPTQEITFNMNNTVVNLSIAACSTSHNTTTDTAQSANSTVVLNSSFPNHQGNTTDEVDKSTRFPLGIAKECNQANNSLNTAMERIKSNAVNFNITNEIRQTGKENICTGSYDHSPSEFPSETNGHSDKFPLDRIEPAATIVQNSFDSSEEHFTPANDYIFSAADFDCLLSRGLSQTVTAAVTTSAASSQKVHADLPRDSVLINFDPLLRRQTIAKADNNGPIGNHDSASACLALIDFAQQHQQQQQQQQSQNEQGCNTTALVSLNSSDYESGKVSQKQDSISGASGAPEVIIDKLNQPLTTGESESVEKVNTTVQCEAISPLEVDAFENNIIEPGDSDSINPLNHTPNQVQEVNGNVLSSVDTKHWLLSGYTAEENFLEGLQTEKEFTEQLFNEKNDNCVTKAVQEEILQPTEVQVTLNEYIPSNEPEHLLESVEESENSTEAGLFTSQSISSPDAESENYLDNIVEFASPPTESNALIVSSIMLAEPLQEQNSTIHNMSDDRMAQPEEEKVETTKKNKHEDIIIADMEKKMHDVELREENMLKRITEKDKTISKMSNVVEAYERTIAELISEKEMLIRNHSLECESLKQDNEINAQHLESLEKTFSNLYAKYERMKKNAVKYKEHEEKLLEKVMKLEECLRAQEQRYEKMKSHAMSQLEIANTKIDEAIRNHSQESAKLKAQIKKEELYRISINEQLIQKSKENEELVKICDELISETN